MNVWDTFCIDILNVKFKCQCEGGLTRSTMYKASRSVFEFNLSLSLCQGGSNANGETKWWGIKSPGNKVGSYAV